MNQSRMIRRFAITGVCGFLGSHLVEHILRSPDVDVVLGIDMLVEDSSDIGRIASFLNDPRFVFDVSSYGNEERIYQVLALNHIEAILHLGAETHVDKSYSDPVGTLANNVIEGCKLLKAVQRYHASKGSSFKLFFNMSTDEVYGGSPETKDERSALLPTNPYSASKASMEHLVHAFATSYGIPRVTLRGNNIYGTRQSPDKVVPLFIQRAIRGEVLTIHGTGKQTRNWVHAEDMCRAICMVVQHGREGEIYNVGSPDELSIMDLAREIVRRTASTSQILCVADRPHNDSAYKISYQKMSQELGWQPRVRITDALDDIIECERRIMRKTTFTEFPFITRALQHQLPWCQRSERHRERISTFREVADDVQQQQQQLAPTRFFVDVLPRLLVFGSDSPLGLRFTNLVNRLNMRWDRGFTDPGSSSTSDVMKEISNPKYTHVVSFNGCDVNTRESDARNILRDNILAPTMLISMCQALDKHLTIVASGCAFTEPQMNREQTVDSVTGYASAIARGSDDIMAQLSEMASDALVIRTGVAVFDTCHPCNSVTQMSRRGEKMLDERHKVTVFHEMWPVILDSILGYRVGTLDTVNPGEPLRVTQVLEMYRQMCDPSFAIDTSTDEGQDPIFCNNCALDASTLQALYPSVSNANEAVREAMRRCSYSLGPC